jgi:hypothetical protein
MIVLRMMSVTGLLSIMQYTQTANLKNGGPRYLLIGSSIRGSSGRGHVAYIANGATSAPPASTCSAIA